MTGPGAATPRYARGTRYARGAFLAAACTALALAGHVAGGRGACCVPPLPAVLGTGAVVGALCVGLAGRMMSFRRILAVVGWAQVAFHFAFTFAASGAGPAHHMEAGGPPIAPPPAPGPGAGMAHGLGLGPSMLAGHALAALAAALLLSGAERALDWLYGAVFAAVARPLPIAPARTIRPPRPVVVVVAGDPAPRLGVLLARAVRRRGPPVAPPRAA
ncbi:hypothetical protein [Actinomadura sp. NEAU-AAG7]|uniref:hypothetical protein n=1 Tax=Actinomadura sp. NEAU-AAG7 TaxID=2839640 RepID=UPI001BE41972|nr:hypothetical protein [Actinomadura sp. NEAU-AAG7]MBT2214196.1 hypothetical protein [Actinomadura sp. NEAU-AAG7]